VTTAADAPPRTTGSDAAPEPLVCKVCGREFTAKIGLFNHAKTHDLKPGEGPGVDAPKAVKKASKLSEKELEDLAGKTAEHIEALGGVLHAGLVGLKLARIQNPSGRLTIPGTQLGVPLPALETHLAHVVISRSAITARVLVQHAAENETLLKWLVRINGWLEGSETGQLIGAHLAGAAATVGLGGPAGGWLIKGLIGDVVEAVEQENRELRHQIAQLQAQLQAQAAAANGAWRPPGDERGAGN